MCSISSTLECTVAKGPCTVALQTHYNNRIQIRNLSSLNTDVFICSYWQLTDFSICGQAEPVRMIFHVAGIEYEEQLVEKENWCVLRQAVPADRMPVLNVTTPNGDSSVYNERMAICRWLAKEYNLMGRSSSEYYLVEQMLSMVSCYKNSYVRDL